MKAILIVSLIMMITMSLSFAQDEINPSQSVAEEEAVEVGDMETSSCSAHANMGEPSEVEAESGSSKEVKKPQAGTQ